MEFFSKAFSWFADISSKLPVIDFKSYFIVVLLTILVAGIIVALTYLGSGAYKLRSACVRINKYLSKIQVLRDDNIQEFINQCFTSKLPASLKDSWIAYVQVRFGFPSEIVSVKNVYEKEVSAKRGIRPFIFLACGLIILAVFAFWGFGTLDKIDMSVIHFFGLLFVGVIFLLLMLLEKKITKSCYETFYKMQEELDVKVDIQVERNYATDSSPLSDLAVMIDAIIARNTAKIVDLTDEMNAADESAVEESVNEIPSVVGKTPIETLIDIETAMSDSEDVSQEKTVSENVPEEVKPVNEPKEEIPSSKEENTISEEPQPQPEPVQEHPVYEEPVQTNYRTAEYYEQQFNNFLAEESAVTETPVDPSAIYQDMIPIIGSVKQDAPKKRAGMRLGKKKVELGSLNVEDVLMGSDFSEVEEDEDSQAEEQPKPKKRGRPPKNANK